MASTAMAMTGPPLFHFFGYYGIQPWNSSETKLLCLEVPFQDRPPGPKDVVTIGLVDTETSIFTPIAETSAWNFQQGCMLHWLPTAPGSEIIFNDIIGDGFVSIILDVETGERRILPRPVSAIGRRGRRAISLNFARLHAKRPGYGYAGPADQYASERHPGGDGIFVMDLETGENWLAVSMQDVYEYHDCRPELENLALWFNHTLFNKNDSRFVFLSRFCDGGSRKTAMFTSDPEGNDLRCLVDYGLVSHFDWLDDQEILAWANIGNQGDAFYMINDVNGGFYKVGEGVLTQDGHCSFSPDGGWILTDTYPGRDRARDMMVFSRKRGDLVSLGRFYSDPDLTGEIRCDLHPRWSKRGDKVCFDSTHEGTRQLYVIDAG